MELFPETAFGDTAALQGLYLPWFLWFSILKTVCAICFLLITARIFCFIEVHMLNSFVNIWLWLYIFFAKNVKEKYI
jgi:hypothetical protein